MELLPCHEQYFKSGSDDIDTMQVKQEEENFVPEVCRGCGLRKNVVAFNNSCGCCFCDTCTWKINAKKKVEGLADDLDGTRKIISRILNLWSGETGGPYSED